MLVKYCSGTLPKRSRAKKEDSSRKGITIKYFVKKATLCSGTPNKVPVCQKTFLSLLGVSKARVRNACINYYIKNKTVKETRGGDTRSQAFTGKRHSIDKFIQKLKPIELHYCRGKNERKYLSSDLSLNKLWRIYNSEAASECKVKKSYFRNYVNKTYNIGFGTPAVDVCSICLELSEKIKRCKNSNEKTNLMVQKRVHSLRAKAFFDMLKEKEDDTMKLSFDCQKNQVLPKTPDQSAYYSRQVYMYNFTICQGSSKDKLSKDNVFIYSWTEADSSKGSNEITSALYHRLIKTNFTEEIKEIKLFSDGCGGQNKNSIMIGMLCYWLGCKAPAHIQNVEIVFPVTGHSYMPPDRVFGLIEKSIKKKETIIKPEEYLNIFSQYGTVLNLSTENCPVYDWKAATESSILKPGRWHFRFLPSKRFIVKKNKNHSIKVRGETAYRSDLCCFRSIFKKEHSQHTMEPEIIPPGKLIKPAKLKDVKSLLGKHFGNEWESIEELEFYRNLKEGFGNDEHDIENIDCDPIREEEVDLKV